MMSDGMAYEQLWMLTGVKGMAAMTAQPQAFPASRTPTETGTGGLIQETESSLWQLQGMTAEIG